MQPLWWFPSQSRLSKRAMLRARWSQNTRPPSEAFATIYLSSQDRQHGETIQENDYQRLLQRNLTLPIHGLGARDIQNTFDQGRAGGKAHEATDILSPRGTPVLAMDDGVIQKLFLSKPGG